MPDGFILQPGYRVRDGRPVLQLFGRLESGPAFLVEDDRIRPYFFAPTKDAETLRDDPHLQIEETPLVALDRTPLVRVSPRLPSEVPRLRERLPRCLEADIRFPYRCLIDLGIRSGVSIRGEAEPGGPELLHFRNPELAPAHCRPALRVLSLDLETTPDAQRILSAALVGDGIDEVHLVATRAVAGAIVHADERSLLEAAARRIRDVDPDILTGWNVVDFDLGTWQSRARANDLELQLGRVPGELRLQRDPRFTRQSRADIPGRMVLDGIALLRDAVKLEDYRLETAARQLLGRGKLIDAATSDAATEIQRLWRDDPEALVAYNREDAQLVLDILDQEGLISLCVERSLLSGMQLDRVGASVASFDLLYLPLLRARGVVAESVDPERENARVTGGAVLDSRPGLFENVAVYDFKSLYPSLIRTFNLDPLAHARATQDDIDAPNGAHFSRETALLPGVIERFMESREAAKRRDDRHADQAIKIMMNALFGVLGTPGCRFFEPAIANAITRFGQQTLSWTREAFEEAGVEVLYGDTDSVFVQLQSRERAEAEREARALRERVESAIATRIRQRYAVEPRLTLELEKLFSHFFMPRVRGGRAGSKKRYAGRVGDEVEVVGLEAVRRDWPEIAGRLQRGLLTRIFAGADGVAYTREVLASLETGELDAELVYVKRLRKGSLDSYTATTPPHVQAARKAGMHGGGVVRYVITRRGPEPLGVGEPFPDDVDRSHYVEKVLRPVAESILEAQGRSFDEALGEPSQLSLL